MSQSFNPQRPKVLKFLNDYRKTLSLLKIKSFYANHLCKKNCLQNKLNYNNESCLKSCDQWLTSYYKLKQQKNPDPQQIVLLSSSQVPEDKRAQYQKDVAKLRLGINSYIQQLQLFINEKVSKQSKK